MSERPQPEPPNHPPNAHWADFTARLSEAQHRQLMVALGTGLREARKAAQVAAENGLVRDARESLDLALDWLSQARQLLPPEEPPR